MQGVLDKSPQTPLPHPATAFLWLPFRSIMINKPNRYGKSKTKPLQVDDSSHRNRCRDDSRGHHGWYAGGLGAVVEVTWSSGASSSASSWAGRTATRSRQRPTATRADVSPTMLKMPRVGLKGRPKPSHFGLPLGKKLLEERRCSGLSEPAGQVSDEVTEELVGETGGGARPRQTY
jgi:hypothetical protein